MRHEPLILTAVTLTNALGQGRSATLAALRNRQSGLSRYSLGPVHGDTWVGEVNGLDQVRLPDHVRRNDCRNNRLALLGLEQDGFADALSRCRARYGPARIGVFLGTSTSGIRQTEEAYSRAIGPHLPTDLELGHTHMIHSLTDCVNALYDLRGPSLAVSTACSSSAKVFAVAYRSILCGICDAALVGGVDSLCHTTLYGFNALQLISSSPCRPWDTGRDGINIGEAAGFALLERPAGDASGPALLGFGESSDAYHISTPHPEGVGAALAMRRALTMADVEPDAIDYINLHGTATQTNDASENAALRAVFPTVPAFSSTKGWTGHTLGAAGITEAVIASQTMDAGFLPGTLNTDSPDPTLSDALLIGNRTQTVQRVMSNSFGFGGSNCCLVFGREAT